jgi:hypothetical protein
MKEIRRTEEHTRQYKKLHEDGKDKTEKKHKIRQDKTRQDKTIQDKTRQDKTKAKHKHINKRDKEKEEKKEGKDKTRHIRETKRRKAGGAV